jgi:hemerythrin
MEKIRVSAGVYWISVPEIGLRVLAGCPADSVKHLMRMGLIVPVEKAGVTYETGPNAILLSDTSIQHGSFSNLAEFPILQMFYRQGSIIPGHPNNTGEKPLLIGTPAQVKAQSRYIQRGKYGLLSKKELVEAGLSEEMADEMMRMKLEFSYGKIDKIEDLMDLRFVEKEPVDLKGASLRRLGLNDYELSYGGESVRVDLNLKPGEEYEPAVRLDYHHIRREYFSIIHNGEGDGWDATRPCMGSILVYQGRIYLIDCGPNITQSLTALGISVSEIEGVFQTHAHDDHFAGLPSLVRSDHLIKYYATPMVRHSVMKKLSALMGIPEGRFEHYFEIRDLELDTWNNISGLEAMPVVSPHPVETNVFYFRTFWDGGYRSYAHLADIIALPTLEKMIQGPDRKQGLSLETLRRTKEAYLREATIKKIDAGGGMIHGSVRDFRGDRSGKILIAHTSAKLSDEEKEIGSNATFGAQDVLIPSSQDYSMQSAARYLKSFFPQAPGYDLRMLLNCPTRDFNVGVIVLKRGEAASQVHLVLHGVVELIDTERGVRNVLSAGSFLGEYSGLTGEPADLTYRTLSYVRVLSIPVELYVRFINRNYEFGEIVKFHRNVAFLQETRLFGDMISSRVLSGTARLMEPLELEAGAEFPIADSCLYVVESGEAEVRFAGQPLERIGRGAIFGEESILIRDTALCSAAALSPVRAFRIPRKAIEKIPIVEWKLLELYDRRIMALGMTRG